MKLRIKELRAANGWSQRDLAQRLNEMDQSKLSLIERGSRKLSVNEAAEVASIFGVSVDYLIGVTDRTLAEEKRMIAMFDAINGVEDKLLNN